MWLREPRQCSDRRNGQARKAEAVADQDLELLFHREDGTEDIKHRLRKKFPWMRDSKAEVEKDTC
jgi:hypothetical protein